MNKAVEHIKKVLIVDDDPNIIHILKSYFLTKDHVVLSAESAEEGFDIYKDHEPHIVVTDLVMTGMSGRDLVEKIRSEQKDIWTSIIIMSAYSDNKTMMECRTAGADDFIIKPFGFQTLEAMLNSHLRLSSLQEENRQTRLALKSALSVIDSDREMASSMLSSLLGRYNSVEKNISAWVESADEFSGDMITVVRRDKNTVFALLADATGHGLAAALPTILVSQNFGELIGAGKDLSKIVHQINTMLHTTLPRQYFVAATAIKINFAHKTLEVWSGGLPEAYILNRKRGEIKTITSQNPALGILPPSAFDSQTQLFMCHDNETLVAYTDGLIEIESPSGEKLGQEKVRSVILKTETNISDALKNMTYLYSRGKPSADDISVLTVQMTEQ